MNVIKKIFGIWLFFCVSIPSYAEHSSNLEEVHVWGKKQEKTLFRVAPTTKITAQELQSINISAVEDAISYEPSVVVRRRYIGDANGALSIRGANMFQTARSMVFVDGLPLHYHLQTRWAGAPRWSLVAPGEVASVEVIYGPFSALYSGNAMGGVVRIKTKVPRESSVELHAALFNQFYDRLATEENYTGGRFSASYADKFDDLTVFAFYNHLENAGHPQSFFYAKPTEDNNATVVNGASWGRNSTGEPVIYYGDRGAAHTTTDLLKLKTGYHWDDLRIRTTIAYEKRLGSNSPNNFLTDANGDPFWSGTAQFDGHTFNVRGSRFGAGERERHSLLLGVGLAGALSDDWSFDLNVSHFQILEDVSHSSIRNPADPAFTGKYERTEYDNTGWKTLDFKTSTSSDNMTLTLGLFYNHYSLAIEEFSPGGFSTSGGETSTQALFAEYTWQINPAWDVTLGGRYEHWQAQDGFVGDEQHPDRSVSGLSPKFSLGYTPAPTWELRYSLARALRFPIVAELYQNEHRANAVQVANAQLGPEDGIHHNLMLQKTLGDGFVRLNLFREQIENTIFNQLGIVDGVEIRAFLAIDEVTTNGAELIINQSQLFQTKMDMRFNVSYLDAEITANSVNPAVVGNRFPRLAEWQANLLLTYRFSDDFNVSGGLRYASDSFGRLDNSDTAQNTFGAIDGYLFANLKANWQATDHLSLALGVNNVNNDIAYVYHPWPARTLYMEAGYEF